MKLIRVLFMLLSLSATLGATAAMERNTHLTIKVTSVPGDDLTGQPVTLMHTGYSVSYGSLTLNAAGECRTDVYAGAHSLTIERDGFATASQTFTVAEGETDKTVTVTLTEKVREPFALTATAVHDPFTGKNDIAVSWNKEAPAFFDNFDSYEPFALTFGEWTGIDGDLKAAAPLVGSYPNRGGMQYAQIINPMTVTPTWWYDYPILRPYSGQQYVGFIRTSSGEANDDWLISPAITVGTDNVVSFKARAADQYEERFMVYITEKLDNPGTADFKRIDKGNYETVDHRAWHDCSYDLSEYAGRQVKIAIRYISCYNIHRSFMLMVDDFYVGQPQTESAAAAAPKARARRVAAKSPANRNEKFEIYLDGVKQLTVDDYTATLTDVAPGAHKVGVKAVYLQASSQTAEVNVNIPADSYANLTFNVTANSKLTADGTELSLLDVATTRTISVKVAGGKANIPSLPYGEYELGVAEGAFKAVVRKITVSGDNTIDLTLEDNIIAPYNITANVGEGSNPSVELAWNQKLLFRDSFEDYADFATGTFGEWVTKNLDGRVVYPISLNNQIVTFPGACTQNDQKAVGPMVFNPWMTKPAMMPDDQAIAAPIGDKSVIFFSAQQAANNKWLISPAIEIRDNFALAFLAKGYSSAYPESMEICISDEASTEPNDFEPLGQIEQLPSSEWSIYQIDLSDYAGSTCRIAFRYTSVDAFMAQIDEVIIGPEDGENEVVDYGNVVKYEIYLDGVKIGESTTPTFTIPSVTAGRHTVGIKAIYLNGESEMSTCTISGTSGITDIVTGESDAPAQYYDMHGRLVDFTSAPAGVYIRRSGSKAAKVVK